MPAEKKIQTMTTPCLFEQTTTTIKRHASYRKQSTQLDQREGMELRKRNGDTTQSWIVV
jgi:hypothetical protein